MAIPPGSTPYDPTYYTCTWATGLTTGIFLANPPPVDYGINPATGTYCPPYRPSTGSVISPYENYTEQCDGFGFSDFFCHDPDFERGVEAAEGGMGSALPVCSRNWVYLGCVDTGFGERGLWEGECSQCAVGQLRDNDDCMCYTGSGCPAGYCYCKSSGDCIPCSTPDCEGVAGCSWDPETCDYRCEVKPDCEYNERYDYDTCACVACPPGQCWCETANACVDCDPPEDADEDGCEWNTETCEWDCHDCPEGECWCKATEECVDCSDRPECYEELNCRWDSDACEYVCDDPALKCGPGRAWLGAPDCRCAAGGGADILELHTGWLVRAWGAGSEIFVGTSRDAGATWDDVLVASDGEAGQSAPALAVDQFDTLYLTYHNGTGSGTESFLYRSLDLGATWDLMYSVTGRSFPRACSTPERLLLISHMGTALVVHASTDGGDTFGAAITDAWTDAQERRADLRRDRRGWLHAVYETTLGAISHRYSKDGGDTWTDPEILAAGTDPGYHVGTDRALLTYWLGGYLFVAATDETFGNFTEAVAVPPTAFVAQQLGVVWDRREHPWLVGTVDEEPEVAWSANPYVEWVEL